MDPKRKKLNWEFIKAMGHVMSDGNSHGLGYSAIDTKGNLFSERWWANWQAFKDRSTHTVPKKREHEKFIGIKEMLKGVVDLEDEPDSVPVEKYKSYGKVTEDAVAITLHTRMATSGKEFANTHPFIDEATSTSLVHNGVINNVSKVDNIRSTCDSERILNKYLQHEVMSVPSDVQNMVDELKGYFACGVLTQDKDKRPVLDVFRTGARLSGAIIKELNCFVLSTDIDDIKTVCRQLGLTIVAKKDNFTPNQLVRFDAMTGKIILKQEYKDTTSTYSHTNHRRNYNSQYYDAEWEAFMQRQDALKERAEEERKVINHPTVGNTPVKQLNEAEVLASQEKAAATPGSVEIAATKAIIKRNAADLLNEGEAALDGYELTEGNEMWVKAGGKKH